mgnify:CR=1 FL=1
MLENAFRPLRCNKKIVYNTYTIPTPVYVGITYKIVFRSEYQQQINTMIQPFMDHTGAINEFMIENEGHNYPAFLAEQFTIDDNSEDYTEDERKFQATVSVRVLGYTIGAGPNDASPTLRKRESAVEVILPRERVMYGELSDYERVYGLGNQAHPAQICLDACPTSFPGRAYGSQDDSAGAVNIQQVNNAVDVRVGEIIIARDFLTPVGNGNLHFATSAPFKENSETVYWNGMLLHPGAPNGDYIVWDGSINGRPKNNGITILDHSGSDADWHPPRSAAERNVAFDDVLLVSYIKA